MSVDKKNYFPWETLDTMTLIMPNEVIAYHLYRLRSAENLKKDKEIKDNKVILSSYLRELSREKEEKQRCFQK